MAHSSEVDALVQFWKENVAGYIREKRKASGKVQKEGGVRKTVSLIENAKLNFTLDTLIETLAAVGGNVSEAFHGKVPLRFANPYHQIIHERLQEILEKAPPDAVGWIVGNITTFHDAYVKGRVK
jgi:hypothetical protein